MKFDSWLSDIKTVTGLIILSFALLFNVVQYQSSQELNAEWREAATPVFESRTFGSVETATPDDLKNALNPCYAFTWLERGRMRQLGCDWKTRPRSPVSVQVSFVKEQDQRLDPQHLTWSY